MYVGTSDSLFQPILLTGYLCPVMTVKEDESKGETATSEEAQKRLVADVPERIHRLVRMRCIERNILIRDYILELLAKDGIR